MDKLASIIADIDGWLWGAPLLILLCGAHLFLTFRLGFVQRYIPLGVKLSVSNDKESQGEISQFGALAIALAATIGTGNIVGVATAIAAGGPGAVFWCWILGVFGIATKYAEGLAAVKYRVYDTDGKTHGGPMYAIERGMHCKWLAVVFAVLTVIACFGIGNMTQSNAVAENIEKTLGVAKIGSGFVEMVLVALVVIGGLKSISKVCSTLVPFMALLYVLGCIAVLFMCRSMIIPAVSLILEQAFSTKALVGGAGGTCIMMAMRYGIARGLFSNESGLGSAPIIAANARTRNSVRQALISSTGTFWDTVIICAMTGISVISAVMSNPRSMPVDEFVTREILKDAAGKPVMVTMDKNGNPIDADAQLAATVPLTPEKYDEYLVEPVLTAEGAPKLSVKGVPMIRYKVCNALAYSVKKNSDGTFAIAEKKVFAGYQPTELTSAAFENIPQVGKYVLTVALVIFAFTTILGWYCYGEQAFHYLGNMLGGKVGMMIFRGLFVIFIFIGAWWEIQAVWDFADLANGLMAVPNIICLFALSGVIAAETKKYLKDGSIDDIDPECVRTNAGASANGEDL